MYPELFPDSARYCYVRTDSSYADLANFEDLEAEEKSLVSQAVDARKAEFGDARWCAHRALQELGANPATPSLRGEGGGGAVGGGGMAGQPAAGEGERSRRDIGAQRGWCGGWVGR